MDYDKNKFDIIFGFIGGVIFYTWLINYLFY